MSMSVCLVYVSVCLSARIFANRTFKYSVHVICGRGSPCSSAVAICYDVFMGGDIFSRFL